jgi:acetyl esterase/lipase
MRNLFTVVGLTGVLLGAIPAYTQDEPAPDKPPVSIEQRFKRWDKNGDGKITPDELGMPSTFKNLDRDGNGVISPDEFTAHMNARRGKNADNAPATAAPQPPEIAKHADIRYAETPGVEANSQSLDIYAPKNAKNLPVMIYVHGGAWQGGDKRSLAAAPGSFNGQGFVFVSVNYRLLPEGKHPNNVADVARAIAWVHDHIAQYGGDPSQLFLYGHSAGAHLVALVATDERHLKAAGKSLAILKAVIPLDTNAYDIPKLTADKGEKNLYAQAFGSDPAAQKDASPLAHVAPDKGIPPMLVFHSGSGSGSRDEQGKAFVAALKKAGCDAALIASLEQSHADINRQFGTPGDMVTEAAVKFVNRMRAGSGNAASVGQALDPPLRWRKSLQLPQTDANGKTLVGTEIMELVAHGGRLYAGNSHWGDEEKEESESASPTQVFVLDRAGGQWQVDLELPPEYKRTSFLKSVRFSTDATGKAIPPRDALVLGVNRARVRGGQTPAVVFIRDDVTGKWIERTLGMSDTTKWAVAVRSMGFHRDKVIGADMLFLGVGPGAGIYSGVFDANAQGGVRFNAEPEFRPVQTQRVMDFCDVNGTLYAATQKVLFKRAQDGPQPKWVEVWNTMSDRSLRDKFGAGINPGWVKYDHFRAFAADRDPATGKETLLFGALNRIFRLDPATDHFEPEVDIRELFAKQLTMRIHYAQTQHNDRIHRPDGRESTFIGLEVMFEDDFITEHPEVPTSFAPDRHWDPPKNVHWAKQGFYLERWREGNAVKYAVREVHDAGRSQPDWLARVRSVCESPFADEKGRVLYTSGFSPWGVKVSNTGWIYRGEIPNPNRTLSDPTKP